MKKNLIRILTIMMVTIVSVGFVSCKHETDEVSIVGTWYHEYYDTDEKEYCFEQFTFRKNGTGHYLCLWGDEKGEYSDVDDNEDFTYKFNKSSMILQIVWDDGEEVVIKIESLTDNLFIISNIYTEDGNDKSGGEKWVFKKQ